MLILAAVLTASAGNYCNLPIGPKPTDSGGWGPAWEADVDGRLQPSVSIKPLPGAELWMDVRVVKAGGVRAGWSEGPFTPADSSAFTRTLSLPDLGEKLSAVYVLVTAIRPSDGEEIAHYKTSTIWGYTRSGVTTLLNNTEATTATQMPAVDGRGYIEEGLLGREVTR